MLTVGHEWVGRVGFTMTIKAPQDPPAIYEWALTDWVGKVIERMVGPTAEFTTPIEPGMYVIKATRLKDSDLSYIPKHFKFKATL